VLHLKTFGLSNALLRADASSYVISEAPPYILVSLAGGARMHIDPLTSNSLIVNVYVNRYTIESTGRNSSRRRSFRSRVARESGRRASIRRGSLLPSILAEQAPQSLHF
jgi:hypothetical protein